MKLRAIMALFLISSSSAFGQPKKVQGKGSAEGGQPEVIVVEGERWPEAGGTSSTPGSVIGSGPQGSNGGGSKGPTLGTDNSSGEECKNERIRNGALCGYEIWGAEFSVGKLATYFICRKNGEIVSSNFVKCE